MYTTVVGDGVLWWLLGPETHAVQCDAVSLSLYIYIYLVYVVLCGKDRKHGGASYQGTRINESRKTTKYFTKYFASQIAEGD